MNWYKKDILTTRSGKNQNELSRYSIVQLYHEQINEQADEQAHAQAYEQADEQAEELTDEQINKLNDTDYYIYIINKAKHEISQNLAKRLQYIRQIESTERFNKLNTDIQYDLRTELLKLRGV